MPFYQVLQQYHSLSAALFAYCSWSVLAFAWVLLNLSVSAPENHRSLSSTEHLQLYMVEETNGSKMWNTKGSCARSPFPSSAAPKFSLLQTCVDYPASSAIAPLLQLPLKPYSNNQLCVRSPDILLLLFSQSVCCLKSVLLHSCLCSGVNLGMFNLLTRFQLLFFFINLVSDIKLYQDDWQQSGRVLVTGISFPNEIILVSKQVERLQFCVVWEQFLEGCYQGGGMGP